MNQILTLSTVMYTKRLHFILIVMAAFCLLPTVFSTPVAAAPTPSVSEVARELICPCPDCGKQALDQCPNCDVGQKLRSEIAEEIKQGKSKEQIINSFADRYGEAMVGNPRPRGVGAIAAWIPVLAAGVGLLVVFLVLRLSRSSRFAQNRGAGNNTTESASTRTATPQGPAMADDARLSRALNEFDY